MLQIVNRIWAKSFFINEGIGRYILFFHCLPQWFLTGRRVGPASVLIRLDMVVVFL